MCSVHWGMFSTSGDVQYIGGYHEHIGGISWVHWGISWCMWGISWVHQGMFITLGGYHEYIRGYHEYIRGYHEYIRGCSVHRWNMMHVGSKLVKTFQFLLKTSMYWTYLDVLKSPDVLMISPQCTHGIPRCPEHPPMYWTSPDVLNTHYTGKNRTI